MKPAFMIIALLNVPFPLFKIDTKNKICLLQARHQVLLVRLRKFDSPAVAVEEWDADKTAEYSDDHAGLCRE